MAEKKHKWKQNIEGAFYVDDLCIACDICVKTAPLFFKMNDIDGHAFVFNQPENDSEIELAIKALDECPVEAIGKDG